MTYAYGGDDRLPVDRLLRRENHHPLGVRRNEATKIATEEAAEAATSNKRWTFGAAAGALLVAGTFAAGALGLSGGATPVAGSAPEHAPASPGHNPGGSPVIGAPVPGKDDTAQKPRDDRRDQPTTPASAGAPTAGAPVGSDTSGGQTGGSQGSGGTAGGTSVVEQPDSEQTAPPTQQTPPPTQQPAPDESQQGGGGLGDVLKPVTDTVGDVLSPVTDTVGGILSPLSGGSSTAATTSAPAPSGPALTMINPLGDLLGV